MAKDFTEVAFNPAQFKKELDQFRDLLNSKNTLGEREIQELFTEDRKSKDTIADHFSQKSKGRRTS